MKLKHSILLACLAVVPPMGHAQINFTEDYAGFSWEENNHFFPDWGAIDMEILPNGRFLVAQHTGYLSIWDSQGSYHGMALDIRDEVWSNGDAGLTSMVFDPDFPATPRIYLMYAVETHSDNPDTVLQRYGRITRYDLDPAQNYQAVVPGSRQVLLGHDWSDGILLESRFHATGQLQFGDDGMLLFSVGDAADNMYSPSPNTAIYGPGRFDEALNIGALRAQTLSCYNGKISRIDPETGLGLATNPFYTGNPSDPQSRIWVYGLRNSWRFTPHRGTGGHTSFGTGPGIIWVGDVGLDSYEELNITDKEGGNNFGWPFYEGAISPMDPNTYAGSIPWLDAEDTTTATLAIAHGPHIGLSYPEDIVGGFSGRSITAGFFYDYKTLDDFDESSPTPYPAALDGKYIFADWAHKDLYIADVNEFSQPTNVNLMASGQFDDSVGMVNLMYNPADGNIYALTYWRLYKLVFDPDGAPPTASFQANPDIGPIPLEVTFDATQSSDPGDGELTYFWNFDDDTGATTTLPTVNHTLTENRNYEVQLVVKNSNDKYSTTTRTVYPGNEPPVATIIHPTSETTYPSDGTPVTINYSGTVSDSDGPAPDAYWRVALRHNDHRHELQETQGLTGSISIMREEENTFYLFELFATDSRGYTVRVEQPVYMEDEHSSVKTWTLYE